MYPSVRDGILLWAFPSIKEGLGALGFDAVELEFDRECSVHAIRSDDGKSRLKLESPEEIDEFRKQLEADCVRISALLMSNKFDNPDFDFEVNWTVKAVKAAGALGIPTVRIDAVMHGERNLPVERNVGIFSEAMSRVLDATSDLEVDMGVENHGFQGNNPEFLDAMLAKVNSPRLGLTIDTGNFYWRGHPLSRVYEIIERFAPYCRHTHAKNIAYPPEKREIEREIGWEYGKYVSMMEDGDIDHRRVVQILKKAGYDRDLCLEDESLGKWTGEDRIAAMKRDADFIRGIL
jgi:sugar phosphate isomerase/epimerase